MRGCGARRTSLPRKSVRLLKLLRLLWLFRLAPLARRLFTAAGVKSAALLVALTAVAGGAAFAMLIGIGFVAVLTGAIAQRFLAPNIEEEEEEESEFGAMEQTSRDILAELLEALESR